MHYDHRESTELGIHPAGVRGVDVTCGRCSGKGDAACAWGWRGCCRHRRRCVGGGALVGAVGGDGFHYCINSASLRFTPRDLMKAEGDGVYLDQVEIIE
jgi:hypothetical protein